LCDRLQDPGLGICFNLCHFLRCTPDGDADALLRRAGPRLLAVTVNGAAAKGSDWNTLIQPLDRGDYDLRPLLRTLDAIEYRGPIGLQAFGINLPPREHLARSMTAWRALRSR
jgi:sugar phosphate isomerase/epimerase